MQLVSFRARVQSPFFKAWLALESWILIFAQSLTVE